MQQTLAATLLPTVRGVSNQKLVGGAQLTIVSINRGIFLFTAKSGPLFRSPSNIEIAPDLGSFSLNLGEFDKHLGIVWGRPCVPISSPNPTVDD